MNIRFIWSFAKVYGLKAISRRIPFAISTILSPLALFWILSITSSGTLIPFAILGGLITVLASACLLIINESAWLSLTKKFKDLIIVTKINRTDYLLGIFGSEIFYAIPGIVIYVGLGIIFGIYTPISLILSMIILALMCVSTASLAFYLSLIPKNLKDVWGYTTIAMILCSLVVPAYYPWTILPKALLYPMLLIPTTSASILLQSVNGLTPSLPIAPYVLVIETVVFFVLATRYSRWTAV